MHTFAVDVTIRTLAAVYRIETLLTLTAFEASLMVGLRDGKVTDRSRLRQHSRLENGRTAGQWVAAAGNNGSSRRS